MIKGTLLLTVALAFGPMTMRFAAAVEPAADKAAAQAADKAAKTEKKAAAKLAKREKAELSKMPKPAREALKAETKGGTEIDYFNSMAGDQKVFGALFKNAGGEAVDLRVDRDGKVLTRIVGEAAKAENPVAPDVAAAPVDPKVPVTPADPAVAAEPAPIEHRDLTWEEIPADIQASISEVTKESMHPAGVLYGNAMYGKDEVFEVKYTTKEGKHVATRVGRDGKVLETIDWNPDLYNEKSTQWDDLPKNVQKTYRVETKPARDPEKTKYYTAMFGAIPLFEGRFKTEDGKLRTVAVNKDGAVVLTTDVEIPATAAGDAVLNESDRGERVRWREMSDEVREAFKENNTNAKDENDIRYYEAKFNGKDVYEGVYVDKEGKPVTLRVDKKGKIVSSASAK